PQEYRIRDYVMLLAGAIGKLDAELATQAPDHAAIAPGVPAIAGHRQRKSLRQVGFAKEPRAGFGNIGNHARARQRTVVAAKLRHTIDRPARNFASFFEHRLDFAPNTDGRDYSPPV